MSSLLSPPLCWEDSKNQNPNNHNYYLEVEPLFELNPQNINQIEVELICLKSWWNAGGLSVLSLIRRHYPRTIGPLRSVYLV